MEQVNIYQAWQSEKKSIQNFNPKIQIQENLENTASAARKHNNIKEKR